MQRKHYRALKILSEQGYLVRVNIYPHCKEVFVSRFCPTAKELVTVAKSEFRSDMDAAVVETLRQLAEVEGMHP